MSLFATLSRKPVFSNANLSRTQAKSEGDARKAVIATLKANKAHFVDPTTSQKPKSPNVVKVTDGTYKFGIKYGTQYLEHVFQDEIDDPRTTFVYVEREDVPMCFDIAIGMVQNGVCDAAIAKAIKDIGARVKKPQGEVQQ